MDNKANHRTQRVIQENTNHENEILHNNMRFMNENNGNHGTLEADLHQNPEPTHPSHDHSDALRLQKHNEKLRLELKQMNTQLNSLIERQKYRPQGKETDNNLGKEELKRELENAEKQIQIYSKNFSQLQTKLDLYLNGEKFRELETQLREKEKAIAKLVQETKAQEKIIRAQEKALTSQLSEESTAHAYMKEVKQLRQKIRELEDKDRQRDKLSQRKHEYYLGMEDKYREFCKDNAESQKINLKSPTFRQISTSKSANIHSVELFKGRSQSKHAVSGNTPQLTEEKFREMQNTINILKKALVTHQGRTKTEKELLKNKSQETDQKIKELTEKLKEKERENNILHLKVNEMKRLIKTSLVHQVEDSLQRRDETKWEPAKRDPPKPNPNFENLNEENGKKDLKKNKPKRDEEKKPEKPIENTKPKKVASETDKLKEDDLLKEQPKPEKPKKQPKKFEENHTDFPEKNPYKTEAQTKKKRRNIGIGGLRKEERGKVTQDTQLFTDQDLFKDKIDWYISGVTVWYSTKYITGILAHYKDANGNPIQGSKNVCSNAEGQYKKQELNFEDGDYLTSMTGTFDKTETYVQSLNIITLNGEFYTVGKALETSKPFEFDLNEYEYPVVVFGGLELEYDGNTDTRKEIGSKLSKIGVLIKSDAVEEQIDGN